MRNITTRNTRLVSSLLWFLLVAAAVPSGYYYFSPTQSQVLSSHQGAIGLSIFLLGATVGLAQWIALRIRIKVQWVWVPATAAGFIAGIVFAGMMILIASFLGRFIFHIENYSGQYFLVTSGFIAFWAGVGGITASFQWIALRKLLIQGRSWILSSAASFACAYVINELLSRFYSPDIYVYEFQSTVIFGLLLALFTCVSAALFIPSIDVRTGDSPAAS
jgi:hypothetical protein